jgi:mannose-6-phosphate isomerase-like protein (cupin superfamily)
MQIGESIEAPNMGIRLTCRENELALKFEMRMRGDAAKIPMHVHPHQEERIAVVRGSLRSRSGKIERVLVPGEVVISPPGEAHTIAPAADEEVEVLAELSPALGYGDFLELDRAGYVNKQGRGNPLRLATAKPQDAEFFVAGIPQAGQRALLVAVGRLARMLGYDQPVSTKGVS